MSVVVYGFVKLNRVSFYLFTYESSLTNTYKSRVVSGSAAVGCYYDIGGCKYPLKIKVTSNSTFKTAQTYLTPFYNNMYFFGLNHFIVYHEHRDLDFVANPYSNPGVKMEFNVTGSSGNDVYSTFLVFSGNT
jgi:hypothetical protein